MTFEEFSAYADAQCELMRKALDGRVMHAAHENGMSPELNAYLQSLSDPDVFRREMDLAADEVQALFDMVVKVSAD